MIYYTNKSMYTEYINNLENVYFIDLSLTSPIVDTKLKRTILEQKKLIPKKIFKKFDKFKEDEKRFPLFLPEYTTYLAETINPYKFVYDAMETVRYNDLLIIIDDKYFELLAILVLYFKESGYLIEDMQSTLYDNGRTD